MGLDDTSLRDELARALRARGTRVEHVGGPGALCVRIFTAPLMAPCPDVVVWQDDLAPLLEIDEAWREHGVGAAPRLLLVRERGGLFAGHVETCRPDAHALLAAIERSLRARSRGDAASADARGARHVFDTERDLDG